ncbi:MAG TPA: hypothetical protein VFJ02_19845 [Vicinamibacterales bacterium]|nr:hypothetical protein [Vicinamibacterales bacterium]
MAAHETRVARVLVAAAIIGFVLRLMFGAIYWVDKPLTHDEREYLALAQSLAAGRGFVYDETLETGTAQKFGRAPGYPVFLALLGLEGAHEHAPIAVKVAQSGIGALTVWLIGWWAFTVAGPRAALAGGAIAAVYPPLVVMPSYVLSETLFAALALAAALVLQRSDGENSAGLAVASGVVSGIAALVRPAMLFFLPLAAIWLVLRRRTAHAAALALAAAIVIAPWTIRNYRAYGRVVVIASEGGVTFWTGNHPLARGEGDLAANPDLKRAELEFRGAHPGLTAEALEPLYYRAALSWIAGHPLEWLGLMARKAFYTVVPAGPSYALHSARYRLASVAPYLVVLPFGFAGAIRSWRSGHRPVALFLLAGSAVLMCLVFFPQERFRIPVIDPVLIIFAASLAAGRRP